MEKAQIGAAAGKAADCDASSPFSRATSTAGLDSHHALSVGNRSYQSSSSPSSSFMRNNHMSMAMGTLDHAPPSSVDNSSHSADSCWSSVPTWEHQQPNAGNMETAAAGDYASSGWDIKSGWDWEPFVPVSGRGDGARRLPASDFDLAGSGAVPKSSAFNLGAVSMASAGGGGASQKAFAPAAFASSTPSAITQSSGIPGLAPTGGGTHGNFSSPSEHAFTPDSSRNAGMDFRVKAEVDTPLGLDPQQEQPRKTGSLQDLRASGRKTSPNAGHISDQQANGMSPIDSPQQQQPQPQSQQQQPQQQQRASSQASMLGMGNGIEQQRRLFLGLGGVVREVDDNINNNSSGSSKGTAGEDVKDGAHTNGVDGAPVVGEASLCLKLGRRTYFEDGPAGVGTATGTRTAANSPGLAGSPPGKKQRSQPPAIQIPRCQVEGCKADLSNAKEYHRRHKVCEVHSKAAKVIVNKQEQRFCQQCSRFHELSEFDEGKRSCRRRLAGHNERRRKPQPDSGSGITCVNPSLQTSFYGDDDKRNGVGAYLHQRGVPSPTCLEDSDDGNSLKLNHVKSPWPGMGRMDEQSSLACQIQVTGGERTPYLSRVPLAHPATTSDRLLMLLQSSPKSQIAPMSGGMAGSGVHQFLQGPGPIGQGLTLSSPSGAGVLAGLEATPASQGLSGISDSGRALSLLSSQPWVSRAPSSVSLDLSPRSTLTLDQLLAEDRAPLAQQLMSGSSAGGQQHFSPLVNKLSMQPHSPGNLGVSGNLSINGSGSGDRDHHSAFMSGYQDFGSNSMLALLQGQEIRALQSGNGQHVRPTIDLMQLPSPQSQSNHHATRIGPLQSQGGQYSDFALRGFESSMFDTQQML